MEVDTFSPQTTSWRSDAKFVLTFFLIMSNLKTITLFKLHFRWRESTPMNVARFGLTVNWLPDGCMLAVGGAIGKRGLSDTVELLHWPWNSEKPTQSGWICLAPLLKPRSAHGAAFVSGKLVVAGGDEDGSTECFTLPCVTFPQGQWTNIRPIEKRVYLTGMVPIGDGLLCVSKC